MSPSIAKKYRNRYYPAYANSDSDANPNGNTKASPAASPDAAASEVCANAEGPSYSATSPGMKARIIS